MTKKFLIGMLAMAIALGMTVIGCENVDEDGFENHTINLTPAEENAILLTLKGGTWKDPTVDDVTSADGLKSGVYQTALLDLLDWTHDTGNISSLSKRYEIISKFTREKDNVIKIAFSKVPGLGSGSYAGSGKVKLNEENSGPKLVGLLELYTEEMDQIGIWTIGKNDPVTINIK